MAMRMLGAVVGLALMGCSSAQQASTQADDIQGGRAWGGDYAVGLITFAGTGGVCTGTLISPSVVLTAGHCVQNTPLEGFYLGAGAAVDETDGATPQIPPGMTRYAIDKTALYPGFDVSDLLNHGPSADAPDLALLHLATPVSGVPARKVLTDPSALAKGQSCWIIGYGRNDANGKTTTKQKREAHATITDLSEIEITVKGTSDPGGGVADEGDSGGPLLCALAGMRDDDPWRIVGTVSYGRENGAAHRNAEEMYVRVDKYEAWINAAITSFPEEERCQIAGGSFTFSCKGNELRYCDGERYRVAQTCAAGKTCDAAAAGCR